MDLTEVSRRMLSEAREALQTNSATASAENHQLTERLLSHFEAGPSTAEVQDPLLQTLRAQKIALSLLHRGIQLPATILDNVGVCVVPDQGTLLQQHTNIPHTSRPLHGSQPTIHETREMKAKAVEARRTARAEELDNVPPHLPAHVKLKMLIKQKQLKLSSMQQQLRKQVTMERWLLKECNPSTLMEWSHCKRADPEASEPDMSYKDPTTASSLPRPSQAAQIEIARQKMEQARVQEETQIKMDHAQRLKQMRLSLEDEKRKRSEESARLRRQLELKKRTIQERRAFLSELFVYHRDVMRPIGQRALKARAARNSHVKAFHRRQCDKVTREQNARIAALKEDNYEEYLKLAANTKNQRLRTLLEKTGSIISELGLKVHDQRSAMAAEEEAANQVWLDGRAATPEATAVEVQAQHMIQNQRQYYDEVHVIKEQVEPPSMLVGGTLRHYQLGGLKFLMSLYNNNMNGILADEMGLGKTIQTISFLASLMEKKDNMGPHIILAPKAVLSNWGQEFIKWAPDMAVVMYDGSPDERKQLQRDRVEKGTFNVLVTHYDMVMRDKAALRKVQWDMLIVDEGHRLKNAESRLAEILRSYRFRHRVLLTGTPIQNSLGELWSLLNFVLPRVFNSSETFDEWFAAPFRGQSEAVSEQLNEEEQLLVISRLHQVLRPFMLRRTKREVEKELPSKTEHVIKCAMSAWQKILYQQITDKRRIRGDDKTIRSLQNTAMHLRKTCNHPYLFLQPSYMPSDPLELIKASGKLDLLDRILPKLQATGHRVLLFSQMTRALDMVEDFLQLRSFNYLRLDGKTKSDARAAMLTNFNKEGSECFIFALSTRAGGLGLNLQTADTVIMFDSDWNPQMDQQAEDRAHRIGQKKEVLVLVLVSAGTIEQVILDRAQQKKEIDAKVIQAGMFNDKSTHNERQEALQTVMRRGGMDGGELVHTPPQLNRLLARSPEEFEIFQQRCQLGPPMMLLTSNVSSLSRRRWRKRGRGGAPSGAAAMLGCTTLRTCRMPCLTASCSLMTILDLPQRRMWCCQPDAFQNRGNQLQLHQTVKKHQVQLLGRKGALQAVKAKSGRLHTISKTLALLRSGVNAAAAKPLRRRVADKQNPIERRQTRGFQVLSKRIQVSRSRVVAMVVVAVGARSEGGPLNKGATRRANPPPSHPSQLLSSHLVQKVTSCLGRRRRRRLGKHKQPQPSYLVLMTPKATKAREAQTTAACRRV